MQTQKGNKRGSLGRVARRRSAKPFTPVRIWKRPLKAERNISFGFFIYYNFLSELLYPQSFQKEITYNNSKHPQKKLLFPADKHFYIHSKSISQGVGQISQALGYSSQGVKYISQGLGYKNTVAINNFSGGGALLFR